MMTELQFSESKYLQELDCSATELYSRRTFMHGIFFGHHTLSSNEELLLQDLVTYYKPDEIEYALIPQLECSSVVSLRLIESFCINYSSRFHVCLDTLTTTVHSAYKAALRRWHRSLFDPCRRRTRIYFIHKNTIYDTTLAQLNFLQWSRQTGVYQYCELHHEKIQREMNKMQQEKREIRLTNPKHLKKIHLSKQHVRTSKDKPSSGIRIASAAQALHLVW